MNSETITTQLADALRNLRADYIIMLQALNEALPFIDKSAELMTEDASAIQAREALAAYDAQQENNP